MTTRELKFQIGKNGVTDGVIQSLALAFKTHKIVRISLLKNSVRGKDKALELAQEIAEKLGGNYVHRVLGYTIIMRRKAKIAQE